MANLKPGDILIIKKPGEVTRLDHMHRIESIGEAVRARSGRGEMSEILAPESGDSTRQVARVPNPSIEVWLKLIELVEDAKRITQALSAGGSSSLGAIGVSLGYADKWHHIDVANPAGIATARKAVSAIQSMFSACQGHIATASSRYTADVRKITSTLPACIQIEDAEGKHNTLYMDSTKFIGGSIAEFEVYDEHGSAGMKIVAQMFKLTKTRAYFKSTNGLEGYLTYRRKPGHFCATIDGVEIRSTDPKVHEVYTFEDFRRLREYNASIAEAEGELKHSYREHFLDNAPEAYTKFMKHPLYLAGKTNFEDAYAANHKALTDTHKSLRDMQSTLSSVESLLACIQGAVMRIFSNK